MSTTQNEIRTWLERAKEEGAEYMLVVCDTFDNDDYPVMIKNARQFNKKYADHDGVNMQRIMESYNVNKDWDEQLNRTRCHETPKTI